MLPTKNYADRPKTKSAITLTKIHTPVPPTRPPAFRQNIRRLQLRCNSAKKGNNSFKHGISKLSLWYVNLHMVIGKDTKFILMNSHLNFLFINIKHIHLYSHTQFFSPSCPKPNLEKKLFIRTNSFIIFTCSNPVLLFPGFGQVG